VVITKTSALASAGGNHQLLLVQNLLLVRKLLLVRNLLLVLPSLRSLIHRSTTSIKKDPNAKHFVRRIQNVVVTQQVTTIIAFSGKRTPQSCWVEALPGEIATAW
jgi:hypothetical protein